ncbi:MAG: hypothetical protein Tsb0013_04090 [Phycisphaerales bacterium]
MIVERPRDVRALSGCVSRRFGVLHIATRRRSIRRVAFDPRNPLHNGARVRPATLRTSDRPNRRARQASHRCCARSVILTVAELLFLLEGVSHPGDKTNNAGR